MKTYEAVCRLDKYDQNVLTMKKLTLLFLLSLPLSSCKDKSTDPETDPETPGTTFKGLKPADAFPKLTFDMPIEFTHAGDGTSKVYVVEQKGIIKAFDNKETADQASIFLDIRSKVTSGGEMGLLGLAFHPDYKNNGYFYVNYNRSEPTRQTVIARYKATGGVANAGSETILFTYDQPYTNHKGGKIAFGPDGYLYIATGDGGSGGDPQNNAQNLKNLLGKMLRVDVNATTKGNYGIPSDNPFINNTAGNREEIFAYGLRNPWKFSFDPETKNLWAGDVGQNEVEEIDIIVKGANFGWKIKEGNECYQNNANCIMSSLISPVFSYKQGSDGRSVTGGAVYRGKKIPELVGKYVFGDYVSGKIWALNYDGKQIATKSDVTIDNVSTIAAFGEDADHELFLIDYSGGKIYTLVKK